ncbi:hypothetical protein BSKO_04740 [Bryopsis sp. KO-2023]|nr:hypothetical protein BSKO_04740 [Bryopsis sp. KO-2023]
MPITSSLGSGETGTTTPAEVPPTTSPVEPLPSTGPTSADAFLTAASEGDLATVQTQISNGVNIETKGERERTALLNASFKGHAEVVSLLLESGADMSAADNLGFTAVILAAYQGFGEVVKVLAAQGADLDAKSNEGVPAIFYAAERNHAGAVGVLLDGGADIKGFRRGGATALMIAAQEGNENVVMELISRGANVNVKNGVLKSAMHSAAQGPDNAEIIFALLDAGAEIDAKDRDGNIPLHYASLSGRKSNIEALLSRGSDPTALNVDGDSPADDACKCLTAENSVCNTDFCRTSKDELVVALG